MELSYHVLTYKSIISFKAIKRLQGPRKLRLAGNNCMNAWKLASAVKVCSGPFDENRLCIALLMKKVPVSTKMFQQIFYQSGVDNLPLLFHHIRISLTRVGWTGLLRRTSFISISLPSAKDNINAAKDSLKGSFARFFCATNDSSGTKSSSNFCPWLASSRNRNWKNHPGYPYYLATLGAGELSAK